MSLLGTRRWIKTLILVATVLTGSTIIGLSIFNKQNIPRAAEDDNTELSGLDYVEYTTQDLFSQALVPVPPEQLTDYDKIALTTELAGDNYFRLSTATERQEFLAAWDTSPEYRQFAIQAESGEGGAWQWLEWVLGYCEGGEGVGRIPSGIIEKANAHLPTPFDLSPT